MTRALVVLVSSAALAASGCTWLGPAGFDRSDPTAKEAKQSAIYAAVVRQLVTRDHTYRQADPRFRAVYVLDGPVPGGVANPLGSHKRPRRPFSDELKVALGTSLADLAPVTFVRSRREAFADPGVGKGRVALVVLGPILGDRDRAEVGANLWIDSFPMIWLTYVVKVRGDTWRVTGTTGPMAIA